MAKAESSKLKDIRARHSQTKALAGGVPAAKPKVSVEQLSKDDFTEEIRALSRSSFLDVEQATQALAEQVAKKMGSPGDSDLIEFLETVLLTDEHIRNRIEQELVRQHPRRYRIRDDR